MSSPASGAEQRQATASDSTVLVASAMAFLTLREHLASAVLVNKSWLAAGKHPLSWPSKIHLHFSRAQHGVMHSAVQELLLTKYSLRCESLSVTESGVVAISCKLLLPLLRGLAPSLVSLSLPGPIEWPLMPRLQHLTVTGPGRDDVPFALTKELPALSSLTIPAYQLPETALPSSLKRLSIHRGQLGLPAGTPLKRLLATAQWDRQISNLTATGCVGHTELESGLRLLGEAKVAIPELMWIVSPEVDHERLLFHDTLRLFAQLHGLATVVLYKSRGGRFQVDDSAEEALRELHERGVQRVVCQGQICDGLAVILRIFDY